MKFRNLKLERNKTPLNKPHSLLGLLCWLFNDFRVNRRALQVQSLKSPGRAPATGGVYVWLEACGGVGRWGEAEARRPPGGL